MTDELVMRRALDLAQLGNGSVSPNPMVGCVIVHDGEIIGQGWHKNYGQAHAEVNAVNSVAESKVLPLSTFYITLEPCSYTGKTPACTDLLIKIKPKRVVIASKDPNPRVSGSGITALQKAGIDVSFGVLENDARFLNKRFFVNMLMHRPYIILKWAQTADKFIAKANYDSKWISNAESRQLVHKWRGLEDAILVGRNTVEHDNPWLTTRDWDGKNPIRLIIDPHLKLSSKSHVFTGSGKVYVYNTKASKVDKHIIYVKLDEQNFINDLLTHIYQEKIGSVIVEGGSLTINGFIKHNLWDEARVFNAESKFKEGIEAPMLNSPLEEELIIGSDRLHIMYNPLTKSMWQKN